MLANPACTPQDKEALLPLVRDADWRMTAQVRARLSTLQVWLYMALLYVSPRHTYYAADVDAGAGGLPNTCSSSGPLILFIVTCVP